LESPFADQPAEAIMSISGDFSFDASSGASDSTLLQLQPAFNTLEFETTVRAEDGSNRRSSLTIRLKPPEETIAVQRLLSPDAPQSHRDAVQLDVYFDDDSEEQRAETSLPHQIRGCLLRHFLPRRLLVTFNAAQLRGEAIVRSLSGD